MKKQSQQQGEDIRSLFLKEFVRQVVIAGYAPLIENAKLQRKLATLQSIKKIISHPKIIERPKVVPVQVVNQIPTQLPVPRPGQPLMKQSIMNRPVNQVPNRPSIQKQMIKPQQQVQRQNQAPQAPKPRPDLQLRKITSGTGKAMIIPQKNQNDGYTESISSQQLIPGLVKVNPILQDPSVSSVECPGPDKQLLINRRGVIETSAINLTKEEIQTILDEISYRTRIPLMQGAFKAAFDQYVLSAILSEFVGNRFVISRKQDPYHFE